jgi:hypothetical protein
MSPIRTGALAVLAGVGLGIALTAQQPPAAGRQHQFNGRAVQASRHDLSPALRNIPPEPDAREGSETAAHAPLRIPRAPRGGPAFQDPALQLSTPAPALPVPSVSFDGINNRDGVLPPDVNGDVGPHHYVQWVNLSYAVYNLTGTLLVGPLQGNQLFSGFGGPCSTRNDGDPIALYDEIADRWLLSQFALPNYPSGPFYQCIAVSKTGDPTGQYWRYEFKISDTKLNDYPKFGVWPTGYFMSVNQFTSSFAGAGLVAFERNKMLLGQAARMIYVDTNDTTLGGMLPSDFDGPTLPSAGTPNFFLQFDDVPAQLQVWRFDVNWGSTPATGTFTKVGNVAVAAFNSNMCNYAPSCIPQAGTSSRLDAISDRLMYRLQYRNFGSYETFVTNHTVDVGGDRAGVRWYELRRTGGTFTVQQQGTWAPQDGAHRWMASAAMDKAGNLAVAYNTSSSTMYPAIYYAARLAGDPLNDLGQGEALILPGVGSQTHSASRWGDYSNLSIAPDGCTFWATLEYTNQGTALNTAPWRTRIASFRLPNCVVPPPQNSVGDFNGDGRTDLAVFRPSTSTWYVRNVATVQWGAPGDIPVASDYNGDGVTDVAVYRPSTGQWWVRNQFTVTWGLSSDLPVPGDYNGDGTTDVAVYRPSTGQWLLRNQFTVVWGLPNDVPVPGDYNGDGVTDVAVFRPSTGQWFVRNQFTLPWGRMGDVPVPGDYNNDGLTDLAVYRPSPGQWWVRNQFTVAWGLPNDVPVPGDYNGDGAADVAVYRPSTGQWFVRNQFTVQWGRTGDMPVVQP